jgi:hypothetical protein
MPNPTQLPHRRDLLALTGLAVGGAVMSQIPDQRPDSVTLAQHQEELAQLAANYEKVPPAQSVVEGWALTHRAGTIGGMAGRDLRPDWSAVTARAMVLEANALVDTGDRAEAARVAGHAAQLAARIGDEHTIAHAYAVRSAVAQSAGQWANAAQLAMKGQAHAGAAPIAVMLVVNQARAEAALGNLPGARESVKRGQALMSSQPSDTWGALGYSLDAYHPGMFATEAAATLVSVGRPGEAAPYLEQATEWVDAKPDATGLACYLRLIAARGAMHGTTMDLYAAREHLQEAVLIAESAGRPAAWLADGVAELARDAERHSHQWGDLVADARAV